MNIKLPLPCFDMGSLEISNDELILFGGFKDAPLDKIYKYKSAGGTDEGEI